MGPEKIVGACCISFVRVAYDFFAVSIPGPPLTAVTPLQVLLKAGVTVAVGTTSIAVTQAWDVHHMRFDLGWVCFSTSPYQPTGL